MKSLAIVQASDILKLKSKLLEMNKAGLNFENKPKEINPAYIEKILSAELPDNNYEVGSLVSIMQDYGTIQKILKNHPLIYDVFFLDDSHKFFNYFVKLIPALPDLVISPVDNEMIKLQGNTREKSSKVYLGVFVNRKVQVQTASDSIHTGVLKHADSIGVFFEPSDKSDSLFITWQNIKKIIIPKEGKKT